MSCPVNASQYFATETLRDGRADEIRALEPADSNGRLASVASSSEDALYRRLFVPEGAFTFTASRRHPGVPRAHSAWTTGAYGFRQPGENPTKVGFAGTGCRQYRFSSAHAETKRLGWTPAGSPADGFVRGTPTRGPDARWR